MDASDSQGQPYKKRQSRRETPPHRSKVTLPRRPTTVPQSCPLSRTPPFYHCKYAAKEAPPSWEHLPSPPSANVQIRSPLEPPSSFRGQARFYQKKDQCSILHISIRKSRH